MPYPFSTDLQQQIQSRLSAGGYSSEEDLLRDALRALDEEEEDLQAVREAVAEWRAGDEGLALKDAFNEIRAGKCHGLGDYYPQPAPTTIDSA